MDTQIPLPIALIAHFCQRWQIITFALFGSVTRRDFSASSDVDVLVTFAADASWGLFDHVRMQQELEQLFQRPVDLLSSRALEQSMNTVRRDTILQTAQVVYSTDGIVHVA